MIYIRISNNHLSQACSFGYMDLVAIKHTLKTFLFQQLTCMCNVEEMSKQRRPTRFQYPTNFEFI